MPTGSRSRRCIDCAQMSRYAERWGRSERCKEHHDAYRAWYQRKWKFERRYGPDSYPASYEPNPPQQPIVRIDAKVLARLEEVQRLLDRANTAFVDELQRGAIGQRPQIHRDVLRPMNGAAQQLVRILEDIRATRTSEPG